MKKTNNDTDKPIRNDRIPLDPDVREAQMISLATELAYKQLLEGTASSQTINFYLKLGSQRERIEKEILEKQKELIVAKTESIQSAKRTEELYANAIEAFQRCGSSIFTDEEAPKVD